MKSCDPHLRWIMWYVSLLAGSPFVLKGHVIQGIRLTSTTCTTSCKAEVRYYHVTMDYLTVTEVRIVFWCLALTSNQVLCGHSEKWTVESSGCMLASTSLPGITHCTICRIHFVHSSKLPGAAEGSYCPGGVRCNGRMKECREHVKQCESL